MALPYLPKESEIGNWAGFIMHGKVIGLTTSPLSKDSSIRNSGRSGSSEQLGRCMVSAFLYCG